MKRLVLPDGDRTINSIVHQSVARWCADDEITFEAYDDGGLSGEGLAGRIEGADAVLLGSYLPTEIIAQAKRLKVISFLGTGAANFVDIAAARDLGVAVTNTPAYGDTAVAEHALALMFSVARHVPVFDRTVHEGGWFPDGIAPVGLELAGKTVGLIGYGGIGRRFAQMCAALGMEVMAWTRRPEAYPDAMARFVSLPEVLAADVVSVHLSLNEATRGMLNAELLDGLRPGSILINTARSELFAPGDLEDRLSRGDVSAGLDVFDAEPLPVGDRLRAMANVVLTPHQGYNTPESLARMVDIAVANVAHFLAGNPVNLLTE